MKKIILIFISIILIVGCEQQLNSRLGVDGEKNGKSIGSIDNYKSIEPGKTPLIFAPGIVNNGLNNRDLAMSPDGKEIYFTTTTSNYSFATILCSKLTEQGWTKPEVVSFGQDPNSITIEPCLSTDGNTLYFASDKPISDSVNTDDMNIWKTTRGANGWNNPEPLSSQINSKQGEYFPSVTNSGTLYFTREEDNRINFTYRSILIDGQYSTPERLPKVVQLGQNRFNAYISPDESFLITPAMGVEDTVSGVAYYISFRNEDDSWSKPLNMGMTVNQDLGRGWSASLSNDGKYLFYMSSRGMDSKMIPEKLTYDFINNLQTRPQNGNSDIYWVNAEFIDELKKKIEWP